MIRVSPRISRFLADLRPHSAGRCVDVVALPYSTELTPASVSLQLPVPKIDGIVMHYFHTLQWAESSPPKFCLPGGRGCRSPSNAIWHIIGQGQPPFIAKRHLDPVQLFKYSSRVWLIDIRDGRTDGHSCSSLELEAVGLRSISFLVPSLVEFWNFFM